MIDVGLIITLANARLSVCMQGKHYRRRRGERAVTSKQGNSLSQRAKSSLFPGFLALNTNIS